MSKQTILHVLAERRDEMRAWLMENALQTTTEQAHLLEGSVERAYWTHGYQSALNDMLAQYLTDQTGCIEGTTSH